MDDHHRPENSRHVHIAITHVAFHIHLPHLPSLAKKSPLLVNKKGLGISKSDLIFQGIATLLELAPASRASQDRLLWHPRASPSATLDKIIGFNLHGHDGICQQKNPKNSSLLFFIRLDEIHEAMI
jgi:hypothetical protein